jgi:hypothetical protein
VRIESVRYARFAVLPILALILAPGLCRAATIEYEHDGAPLFSITFPDGWYVDEDYDAEAKAAGTHEGSDAGIRILEAMPADGTKLWFGVWVAPKATTFDRALEYVASLDGYLFTDVEASQPRDTELGGMAAKTFFGTARREGEDVEFAVALFEPRDEVMVVALYVGRPKTWEAHKDDLQAVVDSIVPRVRR